MRPWVRIVSACTLDGKIASKIGYSKLSCKYDLIRLHRHRAECDGVMIGANTANIDDPILTVRYVKCRRQPYRVVIDGKLKCRLDLRLFKTAREIPTIVFTTSIADQSKISELKKMGVIVEVLGHEQVPLDKALEVLYHKYGIRKLLVEGGGTLNWNLIEMELVDEIYLTITPYIFANGVSVFHGSGYLTTEESPKMELKDVSICECGRCVVLHYIITRR